ncbi:MAG: MBL fold metallo-hydrolase [Thermoleophilaceae bacterium]|nr:MBL fold metallo-hydrolase [Thermoleophilaceae bacterium]
MKITFLGHAGFCVETAEVIVITDPWLSPTGAFDSAWFQLPRNHHLAAVVEEKLGDAQRERYVYISHEHKDHLDLAFLDSLRSRDFTVVIPDFRRNYLVSAFADYRCKDVVVCGDGDTVPIPGGTIKLYLDDSELNRDSAILVKAAGRSFLNLNDCRIVDALPGIARAEGEPDVFACQFSGAGWHPTCYDYPREQYEQIARKKVRAKFNGVAQAIKTLRPRVYLPSAGPPCFLDPELVHLNFEPVNIFPRAEQLIEYLDKRLPGSTTKWPEVMPGDTIDAATGDLVYEAKERLNGNWEAYIRDYAGAFELFFAARADQYRQQDDGEQLLARVKAVLEEKLEGLTMHDRVETPLYFRLNDLPDRMLRVDFPPRTVELVDGLSDGDFYSVTAPSWEVARVLDNKITWDDFSLTFRMRLNREPDIYHTVVQGFLRLEAEDMNRFCDRLLAIEANQERIVVEADGTRYALNRYCPHQGGDLSRGWVEEGRYLTCPRHQWQFDLENDGEARNNVGSINAVCLDED